MEKLIRSNAKPSKQYIAILATMQIFIRIVNCLRFGLIRRLSYILFNQNLINNLVLNKIKTDCG